MNLYCKLLTGEGRVGRFGKLENPLRTKPLELSICSVPVFTMPFSYNRRPKGLAIAVCASYCIALELVACSASDASSNQLGLGGLGVDG